MITHILAGDALAHDLNHTTSVTGEMIVCREALIDGPVSTENLVEFWNARAEYLEAEFGEPGTYFANAVPEFEKIINLADDDEINLWFEYELFCQVNLWFVLHLLKDKEAKIFRVFPSVRNEDDKWKGFGGLSGTELEQCFGDRIEMSATEVKLGADLWTAYAAQDLETLALLSKTYAESFSYLEEVCAAEIARKRDHRPQKTLQRITADGETNFGRVFERFAAEEGVYGFGDSQVKSMLEKLKA